MDRFCVDHGRTSTAKRNLKSHSTGSPNQIFQLKGRSKKTKKLDILQKQETDDFPVSENRRRVLQTKKERAFMLFEFSKRKKANTFYTIINVLLAG